MTEPTDSPPSSHAFGEALEAARTAFENREWSEAYALLSRLDAGALSAEDLERLATSAYLTGRDEDYFSALEGAYRGFLEPDPDRATRCAFWLGLCLLFAGKLARANGWLARVQALVDADPEPNVHEGFLLLPQIERHLGSGDWQAAQEMARRAVDIGREFAEPDLRACARHQLGRALLGAADVENGLAVLDEVMLDVTGGMLSPIMTGLVYCSVIEACQQVFAVSRAREWTAALATWCEAQPQMFAFSGTCLVHRAEILQLSGQWLDAMHEARRACDRYAKVSLPPAGAALYQEGEVHRLRGDYDAAERAYREASQNGFEPQPGLALMRLAQGNGDVARGSIRRLVEACHEPLARARLLPAYVEIMLSVGELEEARSAYDDLAEIAGRFESEALGAIAAHVGGSVAIAEGDAQRALTLARQAFHGWQQIESPYESARARVLAGTACRALDDQEGAQLEFDAARGLLESLGAAPELERLEKLGTSSSAKGKSAHGLTPRELEVLRHVATGKTNRAIAAELFVSEKTVDRHLSNIFNKLDVSSRTAAAAYAFEHELL